MKPAWKLSLTLLLGLALSGGPSANAQDSSNTLQSLDYAFFAGGKLAVRMIFKHELAEPPGTFTTYYPSIRTVLDFVNMHGAVSTEPIEVHQRDLWTLQVVQSGARTRVIIQLLRPMIREMEVMGKELMLTLTPP